MACCTVGMTQFTVCDFLSPDAPRYVSTFEVTSCIVVVLRQQVQPQTDKKKADTNSFGLAHLNLANVFFEDVGKQNLAEFVKAYQAVGGDLKQTSVHIYGGLAYDSNDVRHKVIRLLTLVTGIEQKQMDIPESGIIQSTLLESKLGGNGQVLSLCCDAQHIYTRKVTFAKGQKVGIELLPPGSQILADTRINEVIKMTSQEVASLKLKTNAFYEEINRLLPELVKAEKEVSKSPTEAVQDKKKKLIQQCCLLVWKKK